MTDTEEVQREVAEAQLRAFLEIIATDYGLDREGLRQLSEDLRWIRGYRQTLGRYSDLFSRSIIGALALALLVAIWEGLKQVVAHVR